MKRNHVVSLCTTAALLGCLTLGTSACGWFFVHGPPAGYQGMNDFSCTQSVAGPVLDLAGFVWFTINGQVNAQAGRVAATAIDAAASVAFVWSGLDGAGKIKACRAAKAQLAARLGRGPVASAGKPAAPQLGPVQPTALPPASTQPKTPKPGTQPPAAPVPASAQPATPGGMAQQAPAAPVVRGVVVSPATDSLSVGQTVQLAAAARTSSGAPVPDSAFAWRSSDPAVASVNRKGLVTARAAGVAVITARAGGLAGRAKIVVIPR